MAERTSWAAASMLRSRLNCRVICVSPSVLIDVIESRLAIVVNCRSSGVATVAAIVSGLAPGRPADTVMVGKSTFGRSFTGRRRKDMMPDRTTPITTSVVMTGRRMNSSGVIPLSGRRVES